MAEKKLNSWKVLSRKKKHSLKICFISKRKPRSKIEKKIIDSYHNMRLKVISKSNSSSLPTMELPSWFEDYHKNNSIMIITLLLIGIIGNVIIIIYFIDKVYKYRTKKISSHHFMTIQLAVVDLCLCVGVLLTSVMDIDILKSKVENLTAIPAQIDMTLSTTSCLVLLLLSYERYRTIVNPFKMALRKRYISLVCLLIWLFSTVIYLPIYVSNLSELKSIFLFEFSMKIGAIILDCVFPTLGMGYFYFGIWKTLKESEKDHRGTRRRENKKNKEASKTLRNLFIVYVCCVWPGRLVLTSISYVSHYHLDFFVENFVLFTVVRKSLVAWVYVNSIANVFIYAFLDKDFRHFVFRVLTLGCLKRQPVKTNDKSVRQKSVSRH